MGRARARALGIGGQDGVSPSVSNVPVEGDDAGAVGYQLADLGGLGFRWRDDGPGYPLRCKYSLVGSVLFRLLVGVAIL